MRTYLTMRLLLLQCLLWKQGKSHQAALKKKKKMNASQSCITCTGRDASAPLVKKTTTYAALMYGFLYKIQMKQTQTKRK